MPRRGCRATLSSVPASARRRLAVALLACAACAPFVAAAPAQARDGGDRAEVRARGVCGRSSEARLRLRAEDGRIRVDTEIRTSRTGLWRLTVLHERRIVVRVNAGCEVPHRAVLRHRAMLPDFAAPTPSASAPSLPAARRAWWPRPSRARPERAGRRTHVALRRRPPVGDRDGGRRRPGRHDEGVQDAKRTNGDHGAALAASLVGAPRCWRVTAPTIGRRRPRWQPHRSCRRARLGHLHALELREAQAEPGERARSRSSSRWMRTATGHAGASPSPATAPASSAARPPRAPRAARSTPGR